MRSALDPKSSRITEQDFARFFNIPATHNLSCTRYEAAGMDLTEWEHEERDATGTVVAIYQTWFGIDGSGASAGSTKYSADRKHAERLTMPISQMLAADAPDRPR